MQTMRHIHTMAHDARAVANALIERANQENQPLTPMQIIKLVYICHGWMLGLYGRPLIRQSVEAWRYGPVVSALYQGLRQYGDTHVRQPISTDDGQFDEYEADLISQVWEKYKHLTGISLSRLTHAPGTPWHTIWNMQGQNSIIPQDLIEEHYARKARASSAQPS